MALDVIKRGYLCKLLSFSAFFREPKRHLMEHQDNVRRSWLDNLL